MMIICMVQFSKRKSILARRASAAELWSLEILEPAKLHMQRFQSNGFSWTCIKAGAELWKRPPGPPRRKIGKWRNRSPAEHGPRILAGQL